ncbi:putative aminodeoxychorismate lyase [Roseovarius albus]|uniref:Endolytic murein transglycosylase n=1 Tax=Roseovarius albus TaxID=1247867 RepID=A0A1X6ZAE9_9RHOB|nr:endolytic transglycosylase MltG [Roseovarius albus]SLN45988.1 putative aminodeoxychorismate lyase [Roseovarius albus]
MWRHIASNALTCLIVLIFLMAGVILWGKNQYASEGPLADQMCLRVERGQTMRRVSENLEEQGAISSGTIFRLGAEYTDKSGALKAGSWLIPEGSSMGDIVELVTKGGASTCGTEVVYRIGVTSLETLVRELDTETEKYVEVASFNPNEDEAPEAYTSVRDESDTRYRIAVAEGVTSWQIVQGLKAADVLDGEVAEIPGEGWLAPDSYEVRRGDTRTEVLQEMQQKQEYILAEAWGSKADDVPLEDSYQALILASIVEKETGLAEERRQVASVFANRLNRGMRLQTDPTVIYGITEGKGILGRGLRQSELRKGTPFNTYIIEGLPPTPIANPGRASIEAAVNPDSTDYIFFVADGTGGHAFAKTLDEHNANVAEWRKIEAERNSQ